MGEFLQDYFYIIIGIVYSLYSLLKRKNKRQQQRSQQSVPKKQETSKKEENVFEEWMDEYFGSPKNQSKSPPVVEKNINANDSPTSTSEAKPILKKEKNREKEAFLAKEVAEQDQADVQEFTEFNLREAIIQKAILDRPYS